MTTSPDDHTELLYNDDPYMTRATATVTEVSGEDVVLDRTLFYPEGGGQAADTGRVAGHQVAGLRRERVRLEQVGTGAAVPVAAVVMHTLPGHDLDVGDVVDLELDWQRRYDNMRTHTLAHLLYIAVSEHLQSRDLPVVTRGCQIEGEAARFDFSADIGAQSLPEIETRVRQLRDAALDAHIERQDSGLRLWRAAEFSIPCGGTHVTSTSEIDGDLHVRRRRKGRGLTRLYVSRHA
ncbi:alanyl-tRNA editing protein [Actinomyces lilanjuaniae]|uniref:Alanyl-tRNA editing protein n=1 Tax=Actinomyces lilanjuaniae TaxID=2321394 RepID=A0ABM6Z478_9ACTO|nr:alanyl-tRNA editing protein [Actinomyces lilanjuaniae]AYD89948.1 alanyl-tRNA editing protein [Actinomyces lilanjuaniae]